MPASLMPSQVYADTTSITAYGKHSAPPMSDLLVNEGSATISGFTTNDHQECFLYAKLLVLNQKDPRENVTTLGLKAMRPDGSARSVQTWALMTKADISHIVNVAVGYPAGTGFAAIAPRTTTTSKAANSACDRSTRPTTTSSSSCVSPAVWSMDTNGVFPGFPGPDEPVLTAEFTAAE
jgi:hypothetical protein